MTTIAIIGAGSVGATIGRKWSAAGHDVRFGVRDPDSPKNADLAPLVVMGPRSAIIDAEVVLLALPWGAVEAALADLGDLAGRIVVDATNPLRKGADGLELTHGHEASGAELIQLGSQPRASSRLSTRPAFRTWVGRTNTEHDR